jgi:two-component system, sensor histidine kinase
MLHSHHPSDLVTLRAELKRTQLALETQAKVVASLGDALQAKSGELAALRAVLHRRSLAMVEAEQEFRSREQRLQEANATLEETRQALEAKTEALVAAREENRIQAEHSLVEKSKFLAMAAHDLRQPMQALSNLLAAARSHFDRGYPTAARALFDDVDRAARLTRSSFNAILDISRLESGFVQAKYAPVDINELVHDLSEALSAFATDKGVLLRVRKTAAPAAYVKSDAELLERVLRNLISNAVKYSDQTKDQPIVLIGVVNLPNKMRIDIVDNGIGIPRDQWVRIFEPFIQIGNSERNREKGVGLGLSIVNSIVKLLSGHRIYMVSLEGCGTRFSLEVPLSEAWSGDLRPAGPAAVATPSDLAGSYVLYVEDDVLVRESTIALLTTHDVICDAFASHAELASALPLIERTPDLLLTDYRLPDGCSAADVIASVEHEFGQAPPTVVLTGEVTSEEMGSLRAAEVLRKPVAPERLLAVMAALCSTCQHSEA